MTSDREPGSTGQTGQIAHRRAVELAELKHQHEVAKTSLAHDLELVKLDLATAAEITKATHQAYLDVSKGSVDRARAGAEFVEKAAAGIAGVYATAIGLAFGLSDGADPLPPSGLAAGWFLGLSLVFAVGYLAFLSDPNGPDGGSPPEEQPEEPSLLPEVRDAARNDFIRWMTRISIQRVFLLHVAVLRLGAGVLFLPAPFIGVEDRDAVLLVGATTIAVFGIAGFWQLFARRATS